MDRIGYRVEELAKMLGMSVSAVRRAIKTGDIPVTRIGHSDIIPAWWVREQFVRTDA